MNDKDTADMIGRCIEEIEGQRRQIEKLRPKADAYDNISVILGLIPRRSESMGEDIVWRLKKQRDEIVREMIKPNPAQVAAEEQ